MSAEAKEEVRETVERLKNPAKAMRDNEDADIHEWLSGLSEQGSIKVILERRKPSEFDGVNCGGALGNYDEPIDPEQIAEEHGGGTFLVRVKRPRKNGKAGWEWFGAKQVIIAGDPKVDALRRSSRATSPANTSDEIAQTAMSQMAKMTTDAQKRAEKAENAGVDTQLIELINAPLRTELAEIRRENRDMREKMEEERQRHLEQVTARPDNSFGEKILENLMGREGQQLAAVREQQSSEMRQLREEWRADLARVRDNQKEDLRVREKQHDREIATLTQAGTTQIDAVKMNTEGRVDGLKAEISRLNRELTEARSEIGTLKSKKDQTLADKAKEIRSVHETLGTLGVGGDEKPMWEKALAVVIEKAAAGDFMSGDDDEDDEQTGPSQAQFEAAVKAEVLSQRRAVAARKPRETKPKEARPEPSQRRGPSESELSKAVQFMEAAIKRGTKPATFAASAMSMLSGEMLGYIRENGVDEFISHAAKMDSGSPLCTQQGKNFARQVGEHLTEHASAAA